MEVEILVGGHRHTVSMEESEDGWQATVDGQTYPVHVDRRGPEAAVAIGGQIHAVRLASPDVALVDGHEVAFRLLELHGVAGAPEAGHGALGPVRPPMTGTIAQIQVSEGDTVAPGDVLFVLEAMKMRNEVTSPAAAMVTAVHVQAGDAVGPEKVVLELGPPDA